MHPRACGGTMPSAALMSHLKGASPRVRGNRNLRARAGVAEGCIPARAGEPAPVRGGVAVTWVHPRACGGTSVIALSPNAAMGASPRVRGNLRHRHVGAHALGCIPARAGEPLPPRRSHRRPGVHPRACGGTSGIMGEFGPVVQPTPEETSRLSSPHALALPARFVALDVEIARRRPPLICAIGVARYEDGREVEAFSSLARVSGAVQFTRIHGLKATDLRSAPAWPAVWKQVSAVMRDTTVVVAFRAEFDRAAILATSALYSIRLPRMRFVCAAALARERLGLRHSLADALRAIGIAYPGVPHEPLADARAAALLALASGSERRNEGAPVTPSS